MDWVPSGSRHCTRIFLSSRTHLEVLSVFTWKHTYMKQHWQDWNITKDSKIPLIQHPRDQTGYSRWHPHVLIHICNFLLLLLYLGCAQLIRGIFYLGISLICWLKVTMVLLYVFWSLHSWTSWQKRRQGMRYHNGWCTDPLNTFFNIFLQSASFLDKLFLERVLRSTFLKCHILM
jgi:hypothetical protein